MTRYRWVASWRAEGFATNFAQSGPVRNDL